MGRMVGLFSSLIKWWSKCLNFRIQRLLFLSGETASSGGSAHGPPRNGSNLPVNQPLPIMPLSAAGVQGPPTNLNIGMDYWSGHGNVSAAVPGVIVDGSQSQPWLQVCCNCILFLLLLHCYSSSVFDCFWKLRTKESLSDKDGSNPIESLLVDQGCVNRYNINKLGNRSSIMPIDYKMIKSFFFLFVWCSGGMRWAGTTSRCVEWRKHKS